ncbi:hypothetical protein [Celerinatantimonas sp. MCCC 1A17872]|uniref:hypothetical protein n=1 Tax=Celerinatantimonas sp. MCCC 1A17872 TaxID=3177514 RepID=UPI0038C133A0
MNLTQEEKAKIESAPILYEWETLGYIERRIRIVRLILSITIFFFFLGCAIYTELYITFIILAIVMSFGTQFFMLADYQYHYYLTRYGYYYTSYQKVPEFGYKLTAIFMVLGVIVAIVGTMVVGPMAFVGGGMFLLTGILGKGLPLGPDMTRNYGKINPEFKYVMFVIIKQRRLSIKTDPLRTRENIYLNYPEAQKEKIISVFSKILSNPETYRLKDEDDYYEHPKFKELMKNKVE